MKMYQSQPGVITAPLANPAEHWDLAWWHDFPDLGPHCLYAAYLDTLTPVYIDEVDYKWAVNLLWRLKISRHRSRGKTQKIYVVTNRPRPRASDSAVFLHKEICFRAHGAPPSPRHTIADHCDGDTMNNRRSNLRWATHKENTDNRYGAYALQLRLGV